VSAGPQLYQLTYTVAEGGELEAGGWQVKQTSAGLPPDYRDLMRGTVCVDISSPNPLPAHPTPDQLAARPVRFTYRSTDVGGLLCRAVPAGLDATGREGNVFSHVRLDPALSHVNQDPELTRPVDWWPSGGWLAPFGVRAVQEAVFDDENPPVAEPEACRSSLLSFLFAAVPGRWELLGPWLDGVQAVVRDSYRTVVLSLPDPADAVWWIAAANHLTSARLSRGLSFSTFERWPAVLRDAAWPRLVVVPAEDLSQPPGEVPRAILVIDGSGAPPERVGQRLWGTPLGQEYEATDWSRAVERLPELGREGVDDLLSTSDEEDLHPGGSRQVGTNLALFLRRELQAQNFVPRPAGSAAPDAGRTPPDRDGPGFEDIPASINPERMPPARGGDDPDPVRGSTGVDGCGVCLDRETGTSRNEEIEYHPTESASADREADRTSGDEGDQERYGTAEDGSRGYRSSAADGASDRGLCRSGAVTPAVEEGCGVVTSDPSPRIPVTAGSTGRGGPARPWDRLRACLELPARDDHLARDRGRSGPPGTEREQVPGAEGVRMLCCGLPDDPEQHGPAEELAVGARQELRALRKSIDSLLVPQDQRIAASLCLIGAADLGHRLRLELWGRYGVSDRRRRRQLSSRRPVHVALDTEVGKVTARAATVLCEARETECPDGMLVGSWGERLRLVGGRLDKHFVRSVLLAELLGGRPDEEQHRPETADVYTDPVPLLVAGQVAHGAGVAGPESPDRLSWSRHLAEPGPGRDRIMKELLTKHPQPSLRWLRRLWWALWGTARDQDTAVAQECARRGLEAVRGVIPDLPSGALRPLLAASWERISFLATARDRAERAVEFTNWVAGATDPGPGEAPEVAAELRFMNTVLRTWAQRPQALRDARAVATVVAYLTDRPALGRGFAPHVALTMLQRCECWPLEGQLTQQARKMWQGLVGALRVADPASLRGDQDASAEILTSLRCPPGTLECCGERGTHLWHLCLQTARLGSAEAQTDNPFFMPLRAGRSPMPIDTLAGIALEAFLSEENTAGKHTKRLRNCLRGHGKGLDRERLRWAVEFLPPGVRQQVWNGYRPREGTAVPAVTSGKDAS
jgi:hypothetical protein